MLQSILNMKKPAVGLLILGEGSKDPQLVKGYLCDFYGLEWHLYAYFMRQELY